jgi:predicted ATP-dependent Lon-type protease
MAATTSGWKQRLFAMFKTSFYTDPTDAVFKALGVD